MKITEFLCNVNSVERRAGKNGAPYAFARCSTISDNPANFVAFVNVEGELNANTKCVCELHTGKRGLLCRISKVVE